MPSPVQKSIKLFKDLGYRVEVTQHWNPYARVRHDLFGLFDLLGMKDNIVGIQVTDHAHYAEHIKKAWKSPNLMPWLSAGGRFVIVSYDARTGKRKISSCEEGSTDFVEIDIEDL